MSPSVPQGICVLPHLRTGHGHALPCRQAWGDCGCSGNRDTFGFLSFGGGKIRKQFEQRAVGCGDNRTHLAQAVIGDGVGERASITVILEILLLPDNFGYQTFTRLHSLQRRMSNAGTGRWRPLSMSSPSSRDSTSASTAFSTRWLTTTWPEDASPHSLAARFGTLPMTA